MANTVGQKTLPLRQAISGLIEVSEALPNNKEAREHQESEFPIKRLETIDKFNLNSIDEGGDGSESIVYRLWNVLAIGCFVDRLAKEE